MEVPTLWLLWTIDTKKICEIYFSVYNVKIVEISKYDLSCIRFYIIIAMCIGQTSKWSCDPKWSKWIMYEL